MLICSNLTKKSYMYYVWLIFHNIPIMQKKKKELKRNIKLQFVFIYYIYFLLYKEHNLYNHLLSAFCVDNINPFAAKGYKTYVCNNLPCTHTHTHARTQSYIHTRHFSFCRLLEIEIIEIFLHTFVTYIQIHAHTHKHTHTYIHTH